MRVPIFGVAKSGWSLQNLKDRAKDSLEKHVGVDPDSLQLLTNLLRYVDGDYQDGGTFVQLRKELGAAQRPLHYLAVPPSLFAVVAEGLAKSGCATNVTPLYRYKPGTWGPEEAGRLIGNDGPWIDPRTRL